PTGEGRPADDDTQASFRVDVTGMSEYPWSRGYAMARQVRSELKVPAAQPFDIAPWVGTAMASASSAGIPGVAAVHDDRCGLVAGDSRLNHFHQARALGRALLSPGQHSFVLSAARGYEERVARAFAAELLAPAEGIRQVLAGSGRHDDVALEAVARRFRVSPLVVRHQYDNQLTRVAGETGWEPLAPRRPPRGEPPGAPRA